MKNLFICADCGARSGFVGAWLSKTLSTPSFDVGAELGVVFDKCHFDSDNKEATQHCGLKIRIRPDFPMLETHMYLSLVKDVYPEIKGFKFSEYSIEAFTKMYCSAILWFDHDQKIDNNLYNKVINFSDTFNTDLMIELYKWYNHSYPTEEQISVLKLTNKKNSIILSENHSCKIAALLLTKEIQLGLDSEKRQWSIDDEYQDPDHQTLYTRVFDKINSKYYN